MIIGLELKAEIGLAENLKHNVLEWNNYIVPAKYTRNLMDKSNNTKHKIKMWQWKRTIDMT